MRIICDRMFAGIVVEGEIIEVPLCGKKNFLRYVKTIRTDVRTFDDITEEEFREIIKCDYPQDPTKCENYKKR